MFNSKKRTVISNLKFLSTTVLISTTALISAISQASEIDLALGKVTAAAEFYSDSGINNTGRISVGGLYNEDDDLLGFVGLTSNNSIVTDRPYGFGVGARGYYVKVDSPDVGVGAIALGINGRIRFTAGLPLALAGDFYYSPKIATFDGGDELVDSRIRLEAKVSPNASAFVGYRRLKLNLKNFSNYKLDDHVQVGIRFKFK